MPRLEEEQRKMVVLVLGLSQTISWASSYYLPAILAQPMAASFGVSPVWVFTAFSLALVVSATVGPWAGAQIDRKGGRNTLILSNIVLAVGLAFMSAAPSILVLLCAWLIVGVGMGIGLYEAAFATVTRIYGSGARGAITGITLIAGFASTVGWPISALGLETWGWRMTCLGWALAHICLAMPLNMLLPQERISVRPADAVPASDGQPTRSALWLLAVVFAATWFNSTAMAAHLPGLLQAAGASQVVAIGAAALVGPAQVAARLLEFRLLRRFHPLTTARIAAAAHPAAAVVLASVGAPASYFFTAIHGAGNGVLTIAKGTLPLVLFGPVGYGKRLGWLNAPSRIVQAAAPLSFGAALAAWGPHAVWLSAAVGMAAMLALIALRRRP